jgi:predicted permease
MPDERRNRQGRETDRHSAPFWRGSVPSSPCAGKSSAPGTHDVLPYHPFGPSRNLVAHSPSSLPMRALTQDLRLSLRHLWRRPAFAISAVLTLAIGIGVNAVAFTVVNGILFKGSVVSAHEDVGRILMLPGGDESGNGSLAEYERLADATRGALELAAEGREMVAWQREGGAETAWVLFISPNYFSMIDVRPLAGRIDVGRAGSGVPSVVIGERFWRNKLNAGSLAGLTLQLNGTTVTVSGVLPESYTGPAGLYSPDMWLPLDDLVLFRTHERLRGNGERWLFLLGKLDPAATMPQVQGRIDAALAAMARDWPDTHKQRSARFRMLNDGNSELRGIARGAALAMGIIGLVLLLACFNVANLLLARAVERERDLAIRAAVGAAASRLVRLVLTDGFVIALLAGAAGLLLAWWTRALVGSFAIPIETPQHIDLTPDARVVGFILLLVAIAGVLPGIWPAVSAARVDVSRVLGSQGGSASGGRPSPLRRWLVGAQIAGSTAFLAIAALFLQSYGRLSLAEMGFDRDRLIVAEVTPSAHGYDAERAERYAHDVMARVRALPGVADVAIADRAPFFIGGARVTRVSATSASCEADDCPAYATFGVGPGYFRTMGIALTEGREHRPDAGRSEVVINQAVANLHWPNGGALGSILRLGTDGVPATVVGITAKTRTRGLDREYPTLYVPIGREHFEGSLTLVARTATAPEPLVLPVTAAAQAVDRTVPMITVKTMRERMAVQLWPFRTVSWLFGICGVLALVLATVGLAGVVVHAVNRRRREFGVRVSIGATPRDLMREVLAGSGRLLVPGLVAGTILAAVAARLVQAAFVGVNVLNPITYLGVAVLQCTVVILASIGPALRASRTDPLVALRAE